MKRALVLGGLTAVLSIPALASGQVAFDRYVGDFDDQPASKIKIDVSFSDGEGTISQIKAKRFPLVCDGDGGVARHEGSATLRGSVKVRESGSFKVADDNGHTTFKARGNVRRNKTFGTFHFFGALDDSAGDSRKCDSGRLFFVARH